MKKAAVIFHGARRRTGHIAGDVLEGIRPMPGEETHLLKAGAFPAGHVGTARMFGKHAGATPDRPGGPHAGAPREVAA